MTLSVKGYAAQNATALLAPFQFERRNLRADDVEINVEYCGVCHSDLHQARNHWGISRYPLVPGHEVIGRVSRVGDKVSKFKVGDLVGVGCMVDACQHCHACEQGLEQYCENGFTDTYNAIDRQDQRPTYGGYSDKMVVNEKFVLSVPENLDSSAVAPILCAGITIWSTLRLWNIGKASTVAVIGLGGLGHLAIKLTVALGADVCLFTRSMDKAEDAYRLGATRVILSTNPVQMEWVENEFDLIIDTVPYPHDLNPYLPTLAINGTLVLVGLVGNIENSLNSVPMIIGRRAIAGSMIGSIKETQELLDFCGKHNIVADVEIIEPSL
ncbi:NAD(P)-dependent alcohol dehydrogenase [Volucribacter amazonae]|uniref:NAD(P)-dependent alcohol dehydrogenase n=1 Tax=Volucribacter amazonae TaxID=256731 RepID=UPI002442A36D|nr:NAD(P)-dependent alcohol dehydrogenase [Volucribacter amazonae]